MKSVLTTEKTKPSLSELRQRIRNLQNEINQVYSNIEPLPELINSANLLRQNEYLFKVNEKNSELVQIYSQYTKDLEKMVSSVFEIQNELKEVLKSQSTLIKTSRTKKKKQSLSRKTTRKKTRLKRHKKK